MDKPNEFKYVLGEKDDALLILFYGKMNSRELVELEKCKLEVADKPQKIIIMNFRDVTACMPAVHTFFVKFQKMFRDSGRLVGLCGLNPDVKFALLSSGIIRENEIYNNIPEAWQALKAAQAKKTTAQKAS